MGKLQKLTAFQTVQANFAVVGISRELVTQSYPLNVKIFMGFLLFIGMIAFECVFIFSYADTFYKYMQSIYYVCGSILFIFALVILVLTVDKLFEPIDDCDTIINASKCNSTFQSRIYFEGKMSQF